jgi:hypothetical protein
MRIRLTKGQSLAKLQCRKLLAKDKIPPAVEWVRFSKIGWRQLPKVITAACESLTAKSSRTDPDSSSR